MKQLSGARGWEYAYKKELETQLELNRTALESAVDGNFHYLRGQIRGIRDAIELLEKARKDYRLDDDTDFAS